MSMNTSSRATGGSHHKDQTFLSRPVSPWHWFMVLCVVLLTACTHEICSQPVLQLFSTDASAFPRMSSGFLLLDANGNYDRSASAADFRLTENGVARTIVNVRCPIADSVVALSSVLVVDISGSMNGGTPSSMSIAKAAAHTWVKLLPPRLSECALVSFDNNGYLNVDFTDDKDRLNIAIDNLTPYGGTSYNAGLLDPPNAALSILGTQKKKPVVLFLTDGAGQCDKDLIVQRAKQIGATIYCICVNLTAPLQLHDITEQTGGLLFDEIRDEKQIVDIYRYIYSVASGNGFCQVDWMSGVECNNERKLRLQHTGLNVADSSVYTIDRRSLPGLSFSNTSVRFKNITPGVPVTQDVVFTALSDSTRVDSILSSSAFFTIENVTLPVLLQKGQSRTLRIRFSPLDSSLNAAAISFAGNFCMKAAIYASGGYAIRRDAMSRIKVVAPNGNERLVGGDTCSIRWAGVLPDDTVRLEYSVDRGVHWTMISDSATNLEYLWRVPRLNSDRCLVRASQILRLGRQDSVIFLRGHRSAVQDIVFSPEAAQVATVSTDSTLRIWETSSGTQIEAEVSVFKRCGSPLGVAWSSDPSTLAVCGSLGAALYSRATLDTMRTLVTATVSGTSIVGQSCHSCDFSPDGRFVLLSTNLARVLAWAVEPSPDPTKNVMTIATAHSSITRCVRSSNFFYRQDVNDALAFASASDDRSMAGIEVRFLNQGGNYTLLSRNPQVFWYVGSDQMWSAVPSPDGTMIAGGTLSGQLVISTMSNAVTYTPVANDAINEVSWSPDGKNIAIGYNSGRIILWDVDSSRIARTLDTNHASILGLRWDGFGTMIGASYLNAKALIWRIADAPLQCDVSDSTFSIHTVTVKQISVVDFGSRSLGQQRDSVVHQILCFVFPALVQGWRCDSAVVRSEPDSSFSLVSGAPVTLRSALQTCIDLEIGFRPRRLGPLSAEIELFIGDTSYVVSLKGVGVQSSYKLGPRMIDFGVVYIGSSHDSLVVPLLHNVLADSAIQVQATLQGPDRVQFTMQSDSSLRVAAHDSASLHLRLRGSVVGRTSTRLQLRIRPSLEGNAAAGTEDIVLYGKVVCGVDSTTPPFIVRALPADTVVSVSEFVQTAFIIHPPSTQSVLSLPTHFKAYFSHRLIDCVILNTTVSDTKLLDRHQYMIEGDRSADTLFSLNILPLLGDTDVVVIRVDSVVFDNACSFRLRTDSLVLRLNGICTAGGAQRLLKGTTLTTLLCMPSPLGDASDILVQLAESGMTTLEVRDAVGRNVCTLKGEYTMSGTHPIRWNTFQLASGVYELLLRTPSERRSLLVVKP